MDQCRKGDLTSRRWNNEPPSLVGVLLNCPGSVRSTNTPTRICSTEPTGGYFCDLWALCCCLCRRLSSRP